MKPDGGQIWFTAAELAELKLPGLPKTKRKINERAADGRWALQSDAKGAPLARQRQARGAPTEYHRNVIPASARAELIKRGIGQTDQTEAGEVSAAWAWFDKASAKVKGEAERRLSALRSFDLYCEAGMTRSAAVSAAAEDHEVGGSTLWNWIALVDGVPEADRLPALAPQRKGGGKEASCDDEIWQGLISDYLRPEKPTWSSCYYRWSDAAASKGLSLPHEKTLKRRLEREIDPRLVIARREGAEALRQTLPPQKRTVAHLHAMEMVNIDGHKFDVFVKMPSGEVSRPLMVAIQDIYSRKFLAWRIGETESAVQTRLTFGDLFRKFGIPKECVLDNGRAFASKWITGGSRTRFRFKIKEEEPTGLLTALGIKIHWALPYRGQSKPIERGFRDLCDTIAKHPELAGAYTGNTPLAKPENYGERAIPFDQFQRVVEREMARHNARSNRRTETAHGRSFDEVFTESYARAPIGKATDEQMRMALLMAEQVSTCRKTGSVQLAGNRYWSPEMSSISGKKVVVRFDPDDLHQPIHVYNRLGQFMATVPLWEATGFNDMGGAKKRAKQEADLKKQVRKAEEMADLLNADAVAARLPDYIDEADLPEPQVVRPVRHRGQTAAALKPREQVKNEDFMDRFVASNARLKLVE